MMLFSETLAGVVSGRSMEWVCPLRRLDYHSGVWQNERGGCWCGRSSGLMAERPTGPGVARLGGALTTSSDSDVVVPFFLGGGVGDETRMRQTGSHTLWVLIESW